ncbi:MAG TPA: Hpt domain-containing protein [Phycisphaerae bacterium]|nr:Hpt domain-containing protein [Phycisphaerae bacterium]HOJ73652.1 Hpt domain-containing protein [Phycisphaerae bacterium]HOM50299.1 Hpt domain-containing protein [Phycisphaerae bacterium]HON67898.1 Hpt domain-containing protein [Phycisphaerae bacterium]HOQ84859.1 Hpt domain-containing protein [Phycisphaerae bacterium]
MADDSSPLFSSLAQDGDMIELVQRFVDDLEKRMAAMQAAFEAHNLAEIAQIAHQLRGTGGSHGFDVLSVAAAGLEDAVRSNESLDRVREALAELTVLCHRATAAPPPA